MLNGFILSETELEWRDTLGSSLGKLYFLQPPISQQFHLKTVQSWVILKALLCTVLLVTVTRTFRRKTRRQMVPDKTPELSTP